MSRDRFSIPAFRSLPLAFASLRRLAGAALVCAAALAAAGGSRRRHDRPAARIAPSTWPRSFSRARCRTSRWATRRRAGDRIWLADLPALRRLQQGDVPAAQDGLHRHRQGALHLPRILPQYARCRRLRAGALPRRRQGVRRRRIAVRPAGQMGLRRQAAPAADRGDALRPVSPRTRRPSASRTRSSPTRSSPSPSAPATRSI